MKGRNDKIRPAQQSLAIYRLNLQFLLRRNVNLMVECAGGTCYNASH